MASKERRPGIGTNGPSVDGVEGDLVAQAVQGRQVAHVGNELKTLSSDDAKGSLDDFFRNLGLPNKAH